MYNKDMELILLFIIVLQFAYMVYKDHLFSKEREKLQLKLMSKDVEEYSRAIDEPEEEPERVEPDVRLPIEEATVEQILRADI